MINFIHRYFKKGIFIKRFEYKIETIEIGIAISKNKQIEINSKLEKHLILLGNDGWELIEIKEALKIAIFKREVDA